MKRTELDKEVRKTETTEMETILDWEEVKQILALKAMDQELRLSMDQVT